MRESNDHSTKSYPVNTGTVRPFRLWDAKAKRQLQWRNYAYTWSAIAGAWAEIQWAKPNTNIEVFDIRNGRHIATFSMRPGRNVHRFVRPDFNFRHKPK